MRHWADISAAIRPAVWGRFSASLRVLAGICCAASIVGYTPGDDHAAAQSLDNFTAARVAISRGQYRQAVTQLTRVIETAGLTGPDLATAYFFRAGSLQRLGRLDAAIDDYDRAIALDDDLAPAYVDRGITYYWTDNYAAAIADYSRALELRPDYDLAYVNRGNALQEIGAFDFAVRDYNHALALNPASLFAFTGRAAAHYRRHEFAAAIGDYNRARSIDPTNQSVTWGRGYALFNLGRYRAAAIDFAMLIHTGETGAYAVMWRYFAIASISELSVAQRQLSHDAIGLVRNTWPGALVAQLLDESTLGESLGAAFSPNPDIRRSRLAELYFILGFKFLLSGDEAAAEDYFERSAARGGSDFADPIVIADTAARLRLAP